VTHRGSVLFEVLLSLALFLGGAAFTISATRSVLSSLDRARRQSVAVDLACAKMAELEAGLTTLADLSDSTEGIDRVGSVDPFESLDDPLGPRWAIDVQTEPTEFAGLTLVVLVVRELSQDAFGGAGSVLDEDADGGLASYTLRQLVRLGDADVDAFEEDEIMRDLPEPAGEGRR